MIFKLIASHKSSQTAPIRKGSAESVIELNTDSLEYLFQFLDIRTLARVAMVCKFYNSLASDYIRITVEKNREVWLKEADELRENLSDKEKSLYAYHLFEMDLRRNNFASAKTEMEYLESTRRPPKNGILQLKLAERLIEAGQGKEALEVLETAYQHLLSSGLEKRDLYIRLLSLSDPAEARKKLTLKFIPDQKVYSECEIIVYLAHAEKLIKTSNNTNEVPEKIKKSIVKKIFLTTPIMKMTDIGAYLTKIYKKIQKSPIDPIFKSVYALKTGLLLLSACPDKREKAEQMFEFAIASLVQTNWNRLQLFNVMVTMYNELKTASSSKAETLLGSIKAFQEEVENKITKLDTPIETEVVISLVNFKKQEDPQAASSLIAFVGALLKRPSPWPGIVRNTHPEQLTELKSGIFSTDGFNQLFRIWLDIDPRSAVQFAHTFHAIVIDLEKELTQKETMSKIELMEFYTRYTGINSLKDMMIIKEWAALALLREGQQLGQVQHILSELSAPINPILLNYESQLGLFLQTIHSILLRYELVLRMPSYEKASEEKKEMPESSGSLTPVEEEDISTTYSGG